MAALELVFTVQEADAGGCHWVTSRIDDNAPITIGYTRSHGDGVAVHGSAPGWPQVAVCANDARALGALIASFGQQLASCEEPGEMMEP